MLDKPTIKEYLKYRNGRYTKTEDGRYYAIITYPKTFTMLIILAVLMAAPIFILRFSDIRWGAEISSDLLILFLIALLFLPAVFYPFERFQRIEEVSEQYQKVLAQPNLKYSRVFTLIGTAIMVLVFSLGSYSFAYLRSLFDTPEAELGIYADGMDGSVKLSTDEGDTIIVVRGELSEEATIYLFTWHTPAIPQLVLDGKVVKARDARQSSPFWFGQYHFHQYGTYPVNTKDIHDGSVLTLTCGKWQYEWEFDVDGA